MFESRYYVATLAAEHPVIAVMNRTMSPCAPPGRATRASLPISRSGGCGFQSRQIFDHITTPCIPARRTSPSSNGLR